MLSISCSGNNSGVTFARTEIICVFGATYAFSLHVSKNLSDNGTSTIFSYYNARNKWLENCLKGSRKLQYVKKQELGGGKQSADLPSVISGAGEEMKASGVD